MKEMKKFVRDLDFRTQNPKLNKADAKKDLYSN